MNALIPIALAAGAFVLLAGKKKQEDDPEYLAMLEEERAAAEQERLEQEEQERIANETPEERAARLQAEAEAEAARLQAEAEAAEALRKAEEERQAQAIANAKQALKVLFDKTFGKCTIRGQLKDHKMITFAVQGSGSGAVLDVAANNVTGEFGLMDESLIGATTTQRLIYGVSVEMWLDYTQVLYTKEELIGLIMKKFKEINGWTSESITKFNAMFAGFEDFPRTVGKTSLSSDRLDAANPMAIFSYSFDLSSLPCGLSYLDPYVLGQMIRISTFFQIDKTKYETSPVGVMVK